MERLTPNDPEEQEDRNGKEEEDPEGLEDKDEVEGPPPPPSGNGDFGDPDEE